MLDIQGVSTYNKYEIENHSQLIKRAQSSVPYSLRGDFFVLGHSTFMPVRLKEGEPVQQESTPAVPAESMPFRCPQCNRLLFKGCITYVEIKCPKCGCVHSVTDQFLCKDLPRSKPASGKINSK